MFVKKERRLVTRESGDVGCQIHHLLIRRHGKRFVKDVNLIGGEEYIPHHKTALLLPPEAYIWRLAEFCNSSQFPVDEKSSQTA